MNNLHLRLRDKKGEVCRYIDIDTESVEFYEKDGDVMIDESYYMLPPRTADIQLGVEIDGHVFYDEDQVHVEWAGHSFGSPINGEFTGTLQYSADDFAWVVIRNGDEYCKTHPLFYYTDTDKLIIKPVEES